MILPDKTALRNLTILVGSTLTVLAGAILSPALPEMVIAFEAVPNAEFLVRLTLTIPALFIVISAPFMGVLLDRWGRRPVLLLSLILYGLAGSSGFLLDSLIAILVSRALLGVAVAGTMSGFTTLIADYFTGKKLSQFMGYQGAAMGAGGMVFLLLAGYLADISWRLPFLVYLFGFLVLPGVLFAITEPRLRAEDQQRTTTKAKATLPLKKLAFVYASAFLGMFVFFVMIVYLPFYLTGQLGTSSTQVGLALALQTLTSVAIALFYQRLKSRFSFRAIFSLIFLAFSLNHILVAFAPSFGFAIAGLLIGGLGLGLMPPNLSVWVASIAPPALRGRAMGGLTTALFLGQFLTPIITQPIVQQVGITGAFWSIGAVALFLTAAFAWLAIRQRGVKSPSLS